VKLVNEMCESKLMSEADDMLREIFQEKAPSIVLIKNANYNFITVDESLLSNRKAFLSEVLRRTVYLSDEGHKNLIIDHLVKLQMDALMTDDMQMRVVEKADVSMKIVSEYRSQT
jgi:hypothetical protein